MLVFYYFFDNILVRERENKYNERTGIYSRRAN